jgi:hypothetical protein
MHLFFMSSTIFWSSFCAALFPYGQGMAKRHWVGLFKGNMARDISALPQKKWMWDYVF